MNAAGIRAQLVISEAGLSSLLAEGLTTGWLKSWLSSAGASSVDVCMLEQDAWKRPAEWFVFVASASELMRVALHFGRRIQACDDGSPGLVGLDSFILSNPERKAWYFKNTPSPSRVLLLPPGDIASDRLRCLHKLNDAQPLLPLYVNLEMGQEASACTLLEAGLCASAIEPVADSVSFGDGGYLPEEIVYRTLREHGLRIRFAESCTAGGLAERLSRLPGSSEVLDCAWVTYSNDAKKRLLGLPDSMLERYGAVSREVVEAMAKAGTDAGHACVAVSGVAGPGGGSDDKPVGTVWMAVALPDGRVHSACYLFPGSRAEVRKRTVVHGFHLLCQ
ncbi:MAG: CinA family protein, partial [Mariprofundaceae bacterium]|nr:CinA family protein [Mariprofundaceae bacterium]